MKSIPKQVRKDIDDIVAKLRAEQAEIDGALSEYEDAVTSGRDQINEKIAAYNEKLTELREIVTEQVSAMDDYMGDKSEKWQDGERGQEYSEWKDTWDNAGASIDDIEELQVEVPSEITWPEGLDDIEAGLPPAPGE